MLFSEKFNVSPQVIKEYGAVNISLTCDTPLFIDPILIYFNDSTDIKNWYQLIVKYLLFLNEKVKNSISKEVLKYYFCFREKKENWLGVSKKGNGGLALGMKFAHELANSINNICDTHNCSSDIHIEKMFLINKGVGKDKISDMVTNIIFNELVKYTESFAKRYLCEDKCCYFSISKCFFDYNSGLFVDRIAYLPYIINKKGIKEFVLLTPRSILRKDEQEINYNNMHSSFDDVCNSISNNDLRYQINKIIEDTINEMYVAKEASRATISNFDINTSKEKGRNKAVEMFPELYDYFIKLTEDSPANIKEKASKEVDEVAAFTYENELLSKNIFSTGDKSCFATAKEEAFARLLFMKNELEINSLWKNLYYDNKPIAQESDLQRLFRLCWYDSVYRCAPEANYGNGPVDFQVSRGQNDACNVEFKLASNPRLNHVFEQIEAYQKSQRVTDTIIVIFYFTDTEYNKASKIYEEGLRKKIDVLLIDCTPNKASASKL